MNIELEMLKAQHEALRTYFMSLLPTIFSQDEQQKLDGSKTWLAKYFLWRFERENLSSLSSKISQSSPGLAKIEHRRFQLQVLMDVAYIQGELEGYDLIRKISRADAELANHVFSDSDGSEAGMIQLIEETCK